MKVFQHWITSFGGVEAVAAKLGVTRAAVYHWVNKRGCPKIETIDHIVKLSKGKLSFDDVITSTRPRKIKK